MTEMINSCNSLWHIHQPSWQEWLGGASSPGRLALPPAAPWPRRSWSWCRQAAGSRPPGWRAGGRSQDRSRPGLPGPTCSWQSCQSQAPPSPGHWWQLQCSSLHWPVSPSHWPAAWRHPLHPTPLATKGVSGESPTPPRGISVESRLNSSNCLSGPRLLALSVHGHLYLYFIVWSCPISAHLYPLVHNHLAHCYVQSSTLPIPTSGFPSTITSHSVLSSRKKTYLTILLPSRHQGRKLWLSAHYPSLPRKDYGGLPYQQRSILDLTTPHINCVSGNMETTRFLTDFVYITQHQWIFFEK